MPQDALHPKAYCTNPGLQSFLLASPGVSTRDPSSERRNYLGEKWPVISTESCDFHASTFGFFYMLQIRDMGQTALFPFRRKACWGFFRPEKSDGFGRVVALHTGGQYPGICLEKLRKTKRNISQQNFLPIFYPEYQARVETIATDLPKKWFKRFSWITCIISLFGIYG